MKIFILFAILGMMLFSACTEQDIEPLENAMKFISINILWMRKLPVPLKPILRM